MLVSAHSHDHSLTLGNNLSLHHKRVLWLIRTHMQKHAVTHPHLLTYRWESFCFVFRLQSRLSQQQVKLSVNCSPRAGLFYSVLSAVWSCLNARDLNILNIWFDFTVNPLMPLVFNAICMKHWLHLTSSVYLNSYQIFGILFIYINSFLSL